MSNSLKWDGIFLNAHEYCELDVDPEINEFCRLLIEKNIRQVLDAGCGCGRNLILFARHNFHVVGIDHSRIALEKAAINLKTERLQKYVELIQTQFSQYDRQSPAILAWHVIGHGSAAEVQQNILWLISLLEKGGYLFFNIPSIESLQHIPEARNKGVFSFVTEEGPEQGIEHTYMGLTAIKEIIKVLPVEIVSCRELPGNKKIYYNLLLMKNNK